MTPVSSGEDPIPIPIHTIHTIHTYIHTYRADHNEQNPTFNDFLRWIKTQSKKHVTTTFPPLLWDVFRECVSKRETFNVKPNHVLENFMKNYVKITFKQLNHQTQLSIFINKPEQVNIAKKQVIIKKHKKKPVDYSKHSFDQLEEAYFNLTNRGDSALGVLVELQKRGINIKTFQKKRRCKS